MHPESWKGQRPSSLCFESAWIYAQQRGWRVSGQRYDFVNLTQKFDGF